MLERRTYVDLIEIERDGTINARLKKCIIDTDNPDKPISAEYHRTTFPPGSDVELQIREVDKHLVAMKAGKCAKIEWDRVRRTVENSARTKRTKRKAG